MTFEGVGEEDPDPLSVELRRKFREALEARELRECEGCPLFSKEIVDFLIDQIVDSAHRMDKASQTMEKIIEIFDQIDENLMKDRMRGDSDR